MPLQIFPGLAADGSDTCMVPFAIGTATHDGESYAIHTATEPPTTGTLGVNLTLQEARRCRDQFEHTVGRQLCISQFDLHEQPLAMRIGTLPARACDLYSDADRQRRGLAMAKEQNWANDFHYARKPKKEQLPLLWRDNFYTPKPGPRQSYSRRGDEFIPTKSQGALRREDRGHKRTPVDASKNTHGDPNKRYQPKKMAGEEARFVKVQ